MSFDVCDDCGGGSGWILAFRLAAMWATPTVLWALYRQLPKTAPASPLLLVFLIFAAGGAALAALFTIRAIDVDQPVQREVIGLVVKGALICAISILAYRRLRGRLAA